MQLATRTRPLFGASPRSLRLPLLFGIGAACLTPSSLAFQQVSCANGQVPICYGEHAQCQIVTVGAVHVYQFVGLEGDEVSLTLAGLTNALDPRAQVFDGAANPIASLSCSTNLTCSFELPFTLPADGAYTILVDDEGGNNTGNYVLDLQVRPPVGAVEYIDYGFGGNRQLDHAGDRIYLAFQGAAGTSINLGVASLTNALDPWVELIDPLGNVLYTDGCDTNLTCSIPTPPFITLQNDGVHHVLLYDNGHNNTGTLSVSLNCVLGTCPPSGPPPVIANNYCSGGINSTGNGALIELYGSGSITANDLILDASDTPPGEFGIYFAGTVQAAGLPLPAPSQGILCVDIPFYRFPLTLTCSTGHAPFAVDLNDLPSGMVVLPGDTWNFQLWFRDGSSSNTTDAGSVTFAP